MHVRYLTNCKDINNIFIYDNINFNSTYNFSYDQDCDHDEFFAYYEGPPIFYYSYSIALSLSNYKGLYFSESSCRMGDSWTNYGQILLPGSNSLNCGSDGIITCNKFDYIKEQNDASGIKFFYFIFGIKIR